MTAYLDAVARPQNGTEIRHQGTVRENDAVVHDGLPPAGLQLGLANSTVFGFYQRARACMLACVRARGCVIPGFNYINS